MDDDLRELERRWQSDGDVDAGERYVRARLRAGSLSLEQVRILADVGDPVALRLAPGEWEGEEPFPETQVLPHWASVHWGREALIEAAVAVAGLLPRSAEGVELFGQPSLDTPGWVRVQAQARWSSSESVRAAHWGEPAGNPHLNVAHTAGLLGCVVGVVERHAAGDARAAVREALVPWLLEGSPSTSVEPPRAYWAREAPGDPPVAEARSSIALPLARGAIPALIPCPAAGEVLTLGRTLPHSQLTITLPNLSRQHLLLRTDTHGQPWIEDARSSSGTYINDQQIQGPHRCVPGDELRLAAGVTFTLRRSDD